MNDEVPAVVEDVIRNPLGSGMVMTVMKVGGVPVKPMHVMAGEEVKLKVFGAWVGRNDVEVVEVMEKDFVEPEWPPPAPPKPKKPKKEKYVQPLIEIDGKYPETLRDMLYVSKNVYDHDKTQVHKLLRRFRNKEPKAFTIQLHKLMADYEAKEREKEERERAEKAAREPVVVRDEGTKKAMGLLENLLEEWGRVK